MSKNDFPILLATGNSGKIKELKELLADLPLQMLGLNEFSNAREVEETGETFAENAVLKASGYALQTGLWALADDSGLEVAALGGAPGVLSARYGGKDSTDEEKIIKLLEELKKTRDKKRHARFVCAMAISDESGEIRFLAEGVCDGAIAVTHSGTRGFGYDPIFIPEGFDRTFGELESEIKMKISHRARAIKKIIRFLGAFTAPQLDLTTFRL